MKRIISVTLLLMMLLAFTACNVTEQATQSPSEIPSPSATERIANPVSDFEYEVSKDGTAVTIKKYIGEATDVVIPDTIEGKPVVNIYISAFNGLNIKSVDISDNVISIDNAAFGNCKELETVRFGANVKYINDGAFGGCISLKEAYLPKKLEQLKTKAFYGCAALETVFIPASLDRSNENVVWHMETFSHTPSLKNIIFEEGIKKMPPYGTFIGCDSLNKIIIPSSVIEIGDPAFLLCKNVTEIVFEGDAPEFTSMGSFDNDPFGMIISSQEGGADVKVYYHADKQGWDTTPLKNSYMLVPIE